MSEKTVRRIEPADLDDVREFSGQVYRRNNVIFTPEYFRWAFERTLGEDRSQRHGAMMALLDGRVIGTFVGVGHVFSAFGRLHEGVWIHDWFTEIGHGPTGLQVAMAGVRGRWFFGGSGHGLQGLAVLRAAFPRGRYFELERLVAIADPHAAAELSLLRSEHTEPFLRTVRVAWPDARVTLEPFDLFGAGYDHVWDDVRGDFAFATHRTAQYMNWRYADHPLFRYERAVARTPHGPAYFVWRNERVAGSDTTVGRMCEAIGQPGALAAGFPAAFAQMRASGIAFVDFFCSNASVNAALVEAGMMAAVTRPELDLARLFQPLEGAVSKSLDFSLFFPSGTPGEGPFDFRRSYITKGDSNQDRPNPL